MPLALRVHAAVRSDQKPSRPRSAWVMNYIKILGRQGVGAIMDFRQIAPRSLDSIETQEVR
jgi:hypothetical protein